jgi:hypothetical protein
MSVYPEVDHSVVRNEFEQLKLPRVRTNPFRWDQCKRDSHRVDEGNPACFDPLASNLKVGKREAPNDQDASILSLRNRGRSSVTGIRQRTSSARWMPKHVLIKGFRKRLLSDGLGLGLAATAENSGIAPERTWPGSVRPALIKG